MNNFRIVIAIGIGFLSSGCASFTQSPEEGFIEISDVRKAIECELASVARVREIDKKYQLTTQWGVKAALDLTLVEKITADGKSVWAIPHTPATVLTPSLALSYRRTRIAHLDFVVSIKGAVDNIDQCEESPDHHQGAGLGTGSWLLSTLAAVSPASHAGMSYTTEFEVVAAPGTRLGYALVRAPIDAGVGFSRTGTHRLSIAIARRRPEQPIQVVVVKKKGLDGMTIMRDEEVRPSVRPDRDDPTLNRLLDRRAPIRLETQ